MLVLLGVLFLVSFLYIFSEINYPDTSQKAQYFLLPSGHLRQVSHGPLQLALSPNQAHQFLLLPTLSASSCVSYLGKWDFYHPPPLVAEQVTLLLSLVFLS